MIKTRGPKSVPNFEFRISSFESRVSRRGFTIIELLVVIAVISMLVSIVIAQLSSARARSRDAIREEHIKTLQSALALYASNGGLYPVTDASGVCLDGTDSVSGALVNFGALPGVPRDPQHNCNGELHYHYTGLAPGSSYDIRYYLESNSNPNKSCATPPCEQHATP